MLQFHDRSMAGYLLGSDEPPFLPSKKLCTTSAFQAGAMARQQRASHRLFKSLIFQLWGQCYSMATEASGSTQMIEKLSHLFCYFSVHAPAWR